jgi:hypothetical protein
MITVSLNGTQLKRLEVPFLQRPIENARDVETLGGQVYTDFISQEREWSLTWRALTEAEYNTLRAIYDSQWTQYRYPTLDIPYYNVSGVPVRMTINDKDIRRNGCDIENVTITLRESVQIGVS